MELEEAQLRYFRQHVEKGIRDILEVHRTIAATRIMQKEGGSVRSRRDGSVRKSRGEILMEALSNPQYHIAQQGGELVSETTVPLMLRFLDMKHLGNYRIYNRQVWGILYHDTLQSVKYEFRSWLETHFPQLLEQFNNPKKQ